MTTETIELDIRGQVCPSCLLLTLREINRHHAEVMAGRARLVVLTGTIPDAVKNMGLSATVDKVEGYYRVAIDHPEAQA